MIQKVAAKGINTAKNVLKYEKNNNKITNVLEKEVNTVKNNIQFPNLKRFLEEAKNTIKAIISKIKGNKELAKANKSYIANYLHHDLHNNKYPEDIARKKIFELMHNENIPDEYKGLIKLAYKQYIGEMPRCGTPFVDVGGIDGLIERTEKYVSHLTDIDSNGYLTSRTIESSHNRFKGIHDSLDFEETISKKLSNVEHNVNIQDVERSYNDIIMGKHSTNIAEQEAEPSLIKTLKCKQEQHITETEEHIVDTTTDYIEDLNEHLFG